MGTTMTSSGMSDFQRQRGGRAYSLYISWSGANAGVQVRWWCEYRVKRKCSNESALRAQQFNDTCRGFTTIQANLENLITAVCVFFSHSVFAESVNLKPRDRILMTAIIWIVLESKWMTLRKLAHFKNVDILTEKERAWKYYRTLVIRKIGNSYSLLLIYSSMQKNINDQHGDTA